MSDIYKYTYHSNKYIDYLINTYIREYDIRKAGPSALLVGGCISKQQYDWICSLPRQERQIQTGLLSKNNPEFEKVKKQVIMDARKEFITQNNIGDENILSIKNDAIYIIDKSPAYTSFFNGNIEFIPKNIYTSFYRYNRTEMYYSFDSMINKEQLDIKNIGDDKLEYHKEYILDFLMYLFNIVQSSQIVQAIQSLQNIINEYVSLQLPLGFYREFNSRSAFKINFSQFSNFYADFLPEDIDKSLLDIGQNFDLFQYLFKIYSTLLLSNNKY